MLISSSTTLATAQPATNAATWQRYLAERQLTAAMLRRATRRGTTSTDFSIAKVTRWISSSVPYVTGTVNPLLPPAARLSPNMESPTIRQKRIWTDCPTPSPFFIAHKPTKSLRGTLVNVKDPLPTPKQWNVVYHIPCSNCPNAYMGQTGRQLSTHVKEHKGVVRRQDKHSLLALHCLTTGHAFNWDRASVIGKGSTKHTRDFIEAWTTTSTCVNQCVTLSPGYRALRNYGRRRRQGHPPARGAIPPNYPFPFSNFYVVMTSALPPVFTLIGFSTLILVQPPLPPTSDQLMFEPQTLNSNSPPFSCFYCFHKPDPSPVYSIYTDLSLYPFNCTRNSPHRHLPKCRSYRLENLWIQISLSRRCPDFLVFFEEYLRMIFIKECKRYAKIIPVDILACTFTNITPLVTATWLVVH